MSEETIDVLEELMDSSPKKKVTRKKKIDKTIFEYDELEKIYSTIEGKKFLEEKFKQQKKADSLSADRSILKRFMDTGNFSQEAAALHLLNRVGANHFRYASLFNDTVLSMSREQIWEVIGLSNIDDIEYAKSKGM